MKKVTSLFLLMLLYAVSSMGQITIGTQVVQSGTTGIGPTNYYWESRRIQWVMTATEILNAGGTAGNIVSIAFDQSQVAGGNLANYQLKMARTNAVDAATHNATPLTTVYSVAAFTPGAVGWRTILFDMPFVWNGTDNLLFDVCWGVNPGYSSTGQVWLYNNVANQMRGAFSGSINQCGNNTTATRLGKPRMQMTIQQEGGVANPTGFTATAISSSQINLGWTLNEKEQDVVIAFNTVATFGTPADGLPLGVNDVIPGGGTVIYTGNGTSFSHLGLLPNQNYYYKAYSFDGDFIYSSGILASAKTFCAVGNYIYEGFELPAFPPDCWSTLAGSGNWMRGTASGYGIGTGSARANFYSISGTVPFDLITPVFSMTGGILSFDHAHATYSSEVDKLLILYSTDGGTNYTVLVELLGGATGPLATAPPQTGLFTPTAAQWATKSFELPAGTNRLIFRAVSAFGNDLYLDNIEIFEPTLVTGSVTSSLTGNPIEGASVKIGPYPVAITAGDGTFEALVKDGTYDVVISAVGYNSKTITGFVVVPGATLDIFLTSPTMEIEPGSFDEVLNYGETSEHDIVITNNGDGELNWFAQFVAPAGKSSREKVFYKNISGISEQSQQTSTHTSSNKAGMLLWDNTYINRTTSGIVSTHLGGLGANGKALTADDFLIPPTEIWTIDYVYTEGFSSLVLLPDAFTVDFFADDNGKPGDLIYTENIVPAGLNLTTQDLYLSAPLVLTGGRYWVSVYGYYATATALASARWNWYTGSIGIEEEASLKDYGSLFALPAEWFYLSEIGVLQPSCYFQIKGEKEAWVSLSDYSGTILPDIKESQTIQIMFDAGAVLPGIYTADLVFSSEEGIESVVVPVSLEVLGQAIPLPGANSWGYVSTYLDLDSKMMLETAMASVLDEMVIMIGTEGIFWPGQNINTLGEWDTYKGYKLKMAEEGLLVFTGSPVEPKSVTFPAGVHIIPVLSEFSVPAATIFGGVNLGKIEFAFGLDGSIYWPFGGIYTLTELVPGYGYLVKFNSTTTLNFNVVKGATAPNAVAAFENTTPWNNVTKTGDVHIIGLTAEATSTLQKGDFIGVFNSNGECTGMAKVFETGQPMAVVVYGNDVTTIANDGMLEAEQMTLKLFSNSDVTNLTPVYSTQLSDNNGTFTINGLSLITDLKGATGIGNGQAQAIRIHPNPSSGLFSIDGVNETFKVVVMNSQGQVVYSNNMLTNKLDLTGQPAGVYFIRLIGNDQTRTEKVVIK